MQAKAVLFTGVNQVMVDQIIVPEPGEGEILVEVVYSSVSPGTELRCLSGKQPNALPYPYIPGYSSVGRVVAAGANTSIPVGTRVFSGGTEKASHGIMWGGHVSHAVKLESRVIPIPDGVDLLDAVFAKLAGIAYHGVRHSRPLPGETVIVVGLGVIGQFSARLHHIAGAEVVAFDLSPARVVRAQADGIKAFQITDSLLDTGKRILPDGADVLVDATGAPGVLTQLTELGRTLPWDNSFTPGSRLIIQGSYPGDLAFDYHAAFRKEVSISVPRDSQPRDLEAVLNLMARGLLRAADLVDGVTALDHAPATYRALQAGEQLAAVFKWGV
jgi:bacteriochlorophyllide a dehydrogenase